MRTYLSFSTDGDLKEFKTKEIMFNMENYSNYTFKENINYNKYNFIILYNKNKNNPNNITTLPFYKKEISGDFLLFSVDNENNLKSLTEIIFLKLLNLLRTTEYNYSSSDDFLSD